MTAITLATMVVEIFAGTVFGSMALLADGMHMASHAVALGISVLAYWYARKRAGDKRFSFGTGKVNALGGFTGALLLAVFAVMKAWESVVLLFNPVEIEFNRALLVSVLGLVVNGVSAVVLGRSHEHGHAHAKDRPDHRHTDHNLKAAYLHVLADAVTSLAAITALLMAKLLGWVWMDPGMGLVGSVLVASWSVGLLRQTSAILLDRQNSSLADRIRRILEDGSNDRIHDLHVWSIAPGVYSVIVGVGDEEPRTLEEYRGALSDIPEIGHLSIEISTATARRNNDPITAPDSGV